MFSICENWLEWPCNWLYRGKPTFSSKASIRCNFCYRQVPNPRISTGLTSTSMERAPAPSSSFVRGKSGYVPFWPGGLDESLANTGDNESARPLARGLRTIPPGFSRGIRLSEDENADECAIPLDNVSGTVSAREQQLVLLFVQPNGVSLNVRHPCSLSILFQIHTTHKI
jgi:hypothetical protein